MRTSLGEVARRSDPSFIKRNTTNPSPNGRVGGKKTFDKLIANTDYAAQQNCKLNLEQFAWAFIARHCLLT